MLTVVVMPTPSVYFDFLILIASEAEGWEGACPRKEGVQCEKTEVAIEQPIAASAWKLYGTRPSLENLCLLRPVRGRG